MPAATRYGAIMPINVAIMHFMLVLLNATNPIQNTGINDNRIGENIEPAERISILSILCHGAINFSDLFISLKNAKLVQHNAMYSLFMAKSLADMPVKSKMKRKGNMVSCFRNLISLFFRNISAPESRLMVSPRKFSPQALSDV
jgi:hypothetical protein